MLELLHRLDKGGIVCEMLPQDGPELRFAAHPGHSFCLGVQARCGIQTCELLAQHSSPSAVSGGSGPSSPGRLRRAAENGLRRRHLGDRHLAIARHFLALGEKESGMRSSKGQRRSCGILELGGSLFYRPAPLHRSCDIMAKALMGASSVRTKPVPIHTETKRQR